MSIAQAPVGAMPAQPIAPEDRRVRQGQRLRLPKWTQKDLFCSMRGHRAIAEAALAAPPEPDGSMNMSTQTQESLQSLLQNMQVPQQFMQSQCCLNRYVAADAKLEPGGECRASDHAE